MDRGRVLEGKNAFYINKTCHNEHVLELLIGVVSGKGYIQSLAKVYGLREKQA
jgi:hypothetical protein